MTLIDVNVLIYAQQPDSKFHFEARRAIGEIERSGETIGLLDIVALGFLRITTSRAFKPAPNTLAEAARWLEGVSRARGVVRVEAPAGTVPRAVALAEQHALSGANLTDAFIAAVALGLAASVTTFNQDFKSIAGVRTLWLTSG